MPIQIKAIAFVFHSVTDIPGARKFYEELLGLKIGSQAEFSPGQWWIEYDIAGQALAITNLFPGKPAAALALEVTDLDATLAAVKAAGFKIVLEPNEFPACRMFQVDDGNGNEITLHQLKSQA